MPGHRQPKSLEGLSLGRVCEQLDGMCRRLQMLSQQSSVVQAMVFAKRMIRPYYINALSTRLRSQIIEETSKMLCLPLPDGSHLVSEPALLFLLALLLSHDIKQLKVYLCCYYGCSHQTSLLKLLASEGIGLESLHFIRSALLRLDCKLLRSALLNMKNLSSLTLRNIANDAMLQVIGKICSNLINLDVACSRQVTDTGLKNLLLQIEIRDKVRPESSQQHTSWSRLKKMLTIWKTKNSKSEKKEKQNVLLECYESKNLLCDTLRVLNIAKTTVTSAGVLLVLLHVPQLESLAEYNYMGKVMEIMNRELIVPKIPLCLTETRSCRTTPIQLELLARACPKIEKLYICEPRHSPEVLRIFPYITSLSMHNISANREWLNDFYDYLRRNGKNLRELNIRMAQSENLLQMNLKEIFSSCPNLHALINDGLDIIWTEGYDPSPLRYLKKIQLGHTVNALTIIKVLSLAPELTALHVYNCYDLTNEHFENLLKLSTKFESGECHKLNKCDDILRNLTCFYINKTSKISAITVLNMFNNYKQLKQIGNLANWGLDYKDVGMIFTNANLNVELCSGSHWLWNNCIQ